MTTKTKTAADAAFQWKCQPTAAAIVQSLVDEICERSPSALRLREKLLRETGTRLVDWVDHIAGSEERVDRSALAAAGFEFDQSDGIPIAKHAGGMFPIIRL